MSDISSLPFTYSYCNSPKTEFFEFLHVEFTRDFGIFKKGEKYGSVDIDLFRGEMKAFENREPVAMQEVTMVLTPINF